MSRRTFLLETLSVALVMLFLVGCGAATPTPIPASPTPAPTATSAPPTATATPVPPTETPTPIPPTPTPTREASVLSGVLKPAVDGIPIAGRKIVLCQIVGEMEELPIDCVLMESAVVSDDEGNFEVAEVPPGSYFIFYDSSMMDFDTGLETWGGETLKIGDAEWLMENFYERNEKDSFDIKVAPKEREGGIPALMVTSREHLRDYGALRFLMTSPFILAHDWEFDNRVIVKPEIADITEGEPAEVEFEVMYFADDTEE